MNSTFPTPLNELPKGATLWETLTARAEVDPFLIVSSIIFLLAILHTFSASFFLRLSHEVEKRHQAKNASQKEGARDSSILAYILHFFGEVEAVFGIWVLALGVAFAVLKDWATFVHYVGSQVVYTEPMFVVIIMAMASTRPVLYFAEKIIEKLAALGGKTPASWWFVLLTLTPLLGSLITEPAAMTIAALLLSRQFFRYNPSMSLKYATLGLLFVNVSVGGTLTHFAAPPVLMVATPWQWGSVFMLTHFGFKAAIGIILSSVLYWGIFRKELLSMKLTSAAIEKETRKMPLWIIGVHVFFMAFTVWQAHHAPLFIGAFLFFLAFTESTPHHQNRIELRGPLLVGFFLASLVIHGGLQSWWIQPLLSSFSPGEIMLGATFLTAFNDNAAITYLATLVPDFSEQMKYAVVAGAVTGGGLTVIANAPNPAGQAILAKFFNHAISPAKLALWAFPPTVVVGLAFWLL